MKNQNDKLSLGSAFGVYAINQVSLVDRPFGPMTNTPRDYVNKVSHQGWNAPITMPPIQSHIAAAADLIAFGPDVTVGNDLIITIRPRVTVPNGSIPYIMNLMGALITQRFTNNQVSPQYVLSIRAYLLEGPGFIIATPYNRDIQVSPAGGANSVSEFAVLPAVPANQFRFDSTGLGSLPNPTLSSDGYLNACQMSNNDTTVGTELGVSTAFVFIFKDQALVSQQLSLVPMFTHEGAADILEDLFLQVM